MSRKSGKPIPYTDKGRSNHERIFSSKTPRFFSPKEQDERYIKSDEIAHDRQRQEQEDSNERST
jgi:hypothetical protein